MIGVFLAALLAFAYSMFSSGPSKESGPGRVAQNREGENSAFDTHGTG